MCDYPFTTLRDFLFDTAPLLISRKIKGSIIVIIKFILRCTVLMLLNVLLFFMNSFLDFLQGGVGYWCLIPLIIIARIMTKIPPFALNELQTSDAKRYDRLQGIVSSFKGKFGKNPQFLCRAPGRVNLIGEHIDYCGYSVLPMAVSQDITGAVRINDDNFIRLANTEPAFKDFTSSLDDYKIDSSNPQWFNYFLCGLKGITEYRDLSKPKGMDVMIDGTVPKASGMSSSSAIVCVAGLATAFANECDVTKHELANECARCERYIGTQGGGMDQSISFLAEKGTAKLISFNPLRAEDVKIPPGGAFVITNSCVKLQKAATSHFNIRVAECKIGVKMLAKHSLIDGSKVQTFLDLQTTLEYNFDQMLKLIDVALHESPYSKEEVCKTLEMTEDQVAETLLSKNTQDVTSFKLHQRAKHVLSEAYRVFQFKDICDKAPEDALVELGKLMDQSHFSCSKLYECSCPELDNLTQICRDAGALGSRLTGAGWGGCAVSLVPSKNLPEFLDAVTKRFYAELTPAELKDVVFATEPGSGAAVFTI